MPFIRHTRDKRGYETTFVMHSYRPLPGGGQTRVLYLFRTPSRLDVGRKPLDDEARVALEHTHPDLSFDWQALDRDVAAPPEESGRGRGPRRTKGGTARPTAVVTVDDESVLGRSLGAAEAQRLRERYAELLQRISRRARSPEERDQLMERAQRLNPDEWADDSAVRAGVSTVEAEWAAVGAALPQRRRGRRAGRRSAAESPAGPEDSVSAIMPGSGEVNELPDDVPADRPDGAAGGPGDDGGPGGAPAGDDVPDGD